MNVGTVELDQGGNPNYRGRLGAFLYLIRREFWEHRILKWMPLGLLGTVLLVSLFSLMAPGFINQELDQAMSHNLEISQEMFGMENSAFNVTLGEVNVENLLGLIEQFPPELRALGLQLMLLSFAKLILFPFAFVLIFYAWGSLGNEHKDRSSLFWKSMPSTAAELVLSKVATVFIISMGVMFLTVLGAQLIILTVSSLAALFYGFNPIELFWAPAGLAKISWVTFKQLTIDTMWFLPGLGYILAFSATGIRSKVLPVAIGIGLVLIDKIWFGGGHVWEYIVRHLLPPGFEQRGAIMEEIAYKAAKGIPHPEFANTFGLDFWSGLVIGGCLIFLTIKLYLLREEK